MRTETRYSGNLPLVGQIKRGPPLEKTVVECLRKTKKTLATAESCTGGLLANRITNVEGCSEIFLEGFILYSNEVKSKRLHLPKSTIQSHGVVSEEVAAGMAERLLYVSGAHYALCTTGIAGPTGGTQQVPTGTIFIGLASHQAPVQIHRGFFPGSRATFKRLAVDAALGMLYCQLLKCLTLERVGISSYLDEDKFIPPEMVFVS